jgi:hypothetical protein
VGSKTDEQALREALDETLDELMVEYLTHPRPDDAIGRVGVAVSYVIRERIHHISVIVTTSPARRVRMLTDEGGEPRAEAPEGYTAAAWQAAKERAAEEARSRRGAGSFLAGMVKTDVLVEELARRLGTDGASE